MNESKSKIVNSEVCQITRLRNGLTVATMQMPHMASVSLGLWVGVGGRHEPGEVSGIAHFIEHLLFKGTKRRSAKQISQDIEGIGGYLNAFTGEENTCFYSKARHDRFDELLDVLTDMFLNSRFDRVEIDKERDVIKEELSMYLDQPHHHVQELLNEILWPDHPLGRSIAGTEQTLDTMNRASLMKFQRANYVTDATLVVAAGNLVHDEVVHAVSLVAGRFPKGTRASFLPAPAAPERPRLRLFTKTVEQTQLALAIRTCSRHDERRFALRLLSTILGENMSSRLFQVVREDHGLAYSIYSSPSLFDDAGALTISAGLDTEKLYKALKLILGQVWRLAEKAPGAAEMRRARDYIIGQIDLSLESTENQMMWLGEQLLGYGKFSSADEVKARLTKITAADVLGVARDFFRPENLSLALVSPLKTDSELRKLLKM